MENTKCTTLRQQCFVGRKLAHNKIYFGKFIKYHFYHFKITFEYTSVIPENVMSKYTQDV